MSGPKFILLCRVHRAFLAYKGLARRLAVLKLGCLGCALFVSGCGGGPYATPEVLNVACSFGGPINLVAPIAEPVGEKQGDWATSVIQTNTNLTPDRNELARLASPLDLLFGEPLGDDTCQSPNPATRVANPSINFAIPISLTSTGLQFTGPDYTCGADVAQCLPSYQADGTRAVYIARAEDCLSASDHPNLQQVKDFHGNPIPCNTADGIFGNNGNWYDIAPAWTATATLNFNCRNAPDCVPPSEGGTVSGTLIVPAQLPVPANSVRIEIAFGLQDYANPGFINFFWGNESSWGGPEHALTRFALQLQNITVLPAAFVQMKVLPYTIVYRPPGDQSYATFAVTQSFGTSMTVGNNTTVDNTKSFEQSLGVQDSQKVFDFIATIQQIDGQSRSNTTAWDTNAQIGRGLTETTSRTIVRSWTVGSTGQPDPSIIPAHAYAVPNNCTHDNWSSNNCAIKPGETFAQDPFWADRIVLLLNPQAALWDFNGTPGMQLLGSSDFDEVSIRDLDACARDFSVGAGWRLSNGQILNKLECLQLALLDPLYSSCFTTVCVGGQSYDPSLFGRGLSLGGGTYGRDPLNPSSSFSVKFSDVFSYQTQQSTNGATSYSATVTDIIGFSWSSGLTLSYEQSQYGLKLGFSADTTVTQGEKSTSSTSMKTTYSASTIATDTNATQIDGVFSDDHDFDTPDCQTASIKCYKPHVDVYLDELFGSYMFRDQDAPHWGAGRGTRGD